MSGTSSHVRISSLDLGVGIGGLGVRDGFRTAHIYPEKAGLQIPQATNPNHQRVAEEQGNFPPVNHPWLPFSKSRMICSSQGGPNPPPPQKKTQKTKQQNEYNR